MGYKTEAEALADARERNKELSGPGAWVQDDGEEVPFLMTMITEPPVTKAGAPFVTGTTQ
jgi:hypothetical protein